MTRAGSVSIDRRPAEGHPRRALAFDLLEAGLGAVEPRAATALALARARVEEADVVVAVGKAAGPMADAALALSRPPRTGLIVVPQGAPRPRDGRVPVCVGDHPVPGARSLVCGERLLALAETTPAGARVVCLWSGGGSALAESLVPGVAPAEWARATDALLRSGVTIGELNAVRTAVSRLKGGRLAAAFGDAALLNVVLSDVPGHPPSVVASGPAMPPRVDAPDPVEVLSRVAAPASVRRAVQADRDPLDETTWSRVSTEVAADVDTARRAVVAAAADRGVSLRDLPGYASGEARDVGRWLAREAPRLAGTHDGLIWGGETTVTVRGDGRGGRNQELVLGSMAALGGAFLASLATDGVDGATDSAGAFADPEVVAAGPAAEVEEALGRNDADRLLGRRGARLVTGPTGTNVADVILWLR